MTKLRVLGILLAIIAEVKNTPSMAARPSYYENFCKDNDKILSTFFPSLYEGYNVHINKDISALSEIKLKFDSSAAVSFDHDELLLTAEMDPINNIIKFIALKDLRSGSFLINGQNYPHHPPYVTSIKINGVENCLEPNQTYFEQVPHKVHTFFDAPDKFCGRRKINGKYTELIVGGSETNYGDWPWHAAMYRRNKSTFKYICGGTIISKFFILTAAHCVTIRGQPVVPDILGVVLGKYSLMGNDKASVELKVFKVISHDEYNHKTHRNDIALLKLRTEIIFNNFVQSACLWFEGIDDHMDTHEYNGSVVGWGFDQSDTLTSELHQGQIPQVPDITCIQFQPVFYSAMLDGTKFCAGYHNDETQLSLSIIDPLIIWPDLTNVTEASLYGGTSVCNGDSGGGFFVFVNDAKSSITDTKEAPGAWYVRGIVSTTLARKDEAICNPNAYAVFTDVSKYSNWIQYKINAN